MRKNIVSKKSYAACVSEDTTYNAVFFVAISSKFIVFVDVTSAISLESNFPSFDCKVLKIEPYFFLMQCLLICSSFLLDGHMAIDS